MSTSIIYSNQEVKETTMNNTGFKCEDYSVNSYCQNCGHKGYVTRKKGVEMPRKDTCPNCGCYTFCPKTIFMERES